MVAVSAGTAAAIAAGAAVAGAAVTAVGAIRQGQAQANQADFAAQVERQKAQRAQEVANATAEDQARRDSATRARLIATSGATGRDPTSGSLFAVQNDLVAEQTLQLARIRNQGDVAVIRGNQQADILKVRGRNARTAGFISAGASLLDGVGRGFSNFS